MNFTWMSWLDLFLRLGLGSGLVFGAAWWASRFTRSGAWMRTLWRVAFVAWMLLLAMEITGVGGLLRWSLGSLRPSSLLMTRDSSDPRGSIEAGGQHFDPVYSMVTEASQGLAGGAGRAAWWPGILWASVALTLVGRSLLSRVWLLTKWGRSPEVSDPRVLGGAARMAETFGLTRVVWRESGALVSPIAFGLVRPTVCLPSSFSTDFTAEQQQAILAHELAHLAGRDSAWYALAEIGCALWWWNPLIWVGRCHFLKASEWAADEATLRLGQGPSVLAECLIVLGRRLVETENPVTMGMSGTGLRSALAERVTRLLELESTSLPPVPWLQRWFLRPLVLVAMMLIGWSCLGWQLSSWGNTAPPQIGWASSLLGQSWAALSSTASLAESASRSSSSGEAGVFDPRASANGSPDRLEVLNRKLDTLTVDRLACKGRSLIEVVEDLSAKSRQADPAGVGLSFIVLPGDQLLEKMRFAFDLPRQPLAVRGVLDSLVKLSPEPLAYDIESYAVILRSNGGPARQGLLTRTFKVPTNSLPMLIRSSTRQRAPGEVPSPSAMSLETEQVLQALARAGVSLRPPKQLRSNLSEGILWVQAESKDFDLIEKLLSDPQIVIQSKWIELSPHLAEETGLFEMVGMDSTRPVPGMISTSVPQFVVRADQLDAPAEGGAEESPGQRLLDPSRVSKLMAALGSTPGVSVLTSPSVITLSARQARIQFKEAKSIVLGAQPSLTQAVEVGPQLDVTPRFTAERNVLDLRFVASLTEFIGYQNQKVATQQSEPLRPVFQTRQSSRSALVKDGESLAFCLGSDAPGVEEVALQNPLVSGKRRGNQVVFVLVTATLVDAAGNRLNLE